MNPKGFEQAIESIQALENFELSPLNVLIGGNGAGKSNFIDFFRLLRAMLKLPLPELQRSSLQNYVNDSGNCHDFLFNGPNDNGKLMAKAGARAPRKPPQ